MRRKKRRRHKHSPVKILPPPILASNEHWHIKVISKIKSLTTTTKILGLLTIFYLSIQIGIWIGLWAWISSQYKSITSPRFVENKNSFNIIIFPFESYNKDETSKLNLEELLVDKLHEINTSNDLNLQIIYDDNHHDKLFYDKTAEFANSRNADIVIWGNILGNPIMTILKFVYKDKNIRDSLSFGLPWSNRIQKHGNNEAWVSDWYSFASDAVKLNSNVDSFKGSLLNMALDVIYTILITKNYNSLNYPEVIRLCEKITIHDKYFAEVSYKMAINSSLNLKEYEKCVIMYNKLIDLDSTNIRYWIFRGEQYYSLKKYYDGINDFTKALEINPKDSSALSDRGESFFALKNYDRAIEDFSKLIELNPMDEMAYYYRAKSYYDLNKFDLSKKDIYSALSLIPSNNSSVIKVFPMQAYLYQLIGGIFEISKQYDSALIYFDKALQYDSSSIYTHRNRATTLGKLKRFKEAITDFTFVINKDVKDLNVLYFRAISYCQLNETQSAINDLNSLLKLNPNYVLAYNLRGTISIYNNDLESAVKDFSKAISLDSLSADAFNNRGCAYNLLGFHDKALNDFKIASKINPSYKYKKKMLKNWKENFLNSFD